MAGGIYSREHCPQCSRSFADNGRNGLSCPVHPEQRATKFYVKFNTVYRRFTDYRTAQAFLGGLRAQKGGLTPTPFDARDYQSKLKPLAFSTLAAKWLAVKEQTVKTRSYANLKNYMARALEIWGDENVKLLGYAEIEDFLFAQKVSDKTRSNMKSALHDFWTWLRKRRLITMAEMPEFPETAFELGMRKIIDKDTQASILEEIRRLTWDINPRIWIGIKWLTDYIAIRPGELMKIAEGDILRDQGVILIPRPKEKRPKVVPLLEEDIELLAGIPVGLPRLPFFRHLTRPFKAKIIPGEAFGPAYLRKWWNRACAALGITGVDMYGGTRHSSATAAGEIFSPEQIKILTAHSTNQAFERYFRRDTGAVREMQEQLKRSKSDSKKKHESRKQ